MTVKELSERLSRMPQDATVALERRTDDGIVFGIYDFDIEPVIRYPLRGKYYGKEPKTLVVL